MKRCSTSLAIRKMQIIATVRYHFIHSRMAVIKGQIMTNIGRDVEKLEPSYAANENVKWYSHFRTVPQKFKYSDCPTPKRNENMFTKTFT